jgi:hypothetical protein
LVCVSAGRRFCSCGGLFRQVGGGVSSRGRGHVWES